MFVSSGPGRTGTPYRTHAAESFRSPPSIADLEAAGVVWERLDDEDELEIARDKGFVALRDPGDPGMVRIMDEDGWDAFWFGSDQYEADLSGWPQDLCDAVTFDDQTD